MFLIYSIDQRIKNILLNFQNLIFYTKSFMNFLFQNNLLITMFLSKF